MIAGGNHSIIQMNGSPTAKTYISDNYQLNTNLPHTAFPLLSRRLPKKLYIRHKYIDIYLTNPTYGIIMKTV